jgi:hypothetical protein
MDAAAESDEEGETSMAMLRICAADGCNTKTLGLHCIQHELVPRVVVLRRDARPLVGAANAA